MAQNIESDFEIVSFADNKKKQEEINKLQETVKLLTETTQNHQTLLASLVKTNVNLDEENKQLKEILTVILDGNEKIQKALQAQEVCRQREAALELKNKEEIKRRNDEMCDNQTSKASEVRQQCMPNEVGQRRMPKEVGQRRTKMEDTEHDDTDDDTDDDNYNKANHTGYEYEVHEYKKNFNERNKIVFKNQLVINGRGNRGGGVFYDNCIIINSHGYPICAKNSIYIGGFCQIFGNNNIIITHGNTAIGFGNLIIGILTSTVNIPNMPKSIVYGSTTSNEGNVDTYGTKLGWRNKKIFSKPTVDENDVLMTIWKMTDASSNCGYHKSVAIAKELQEYFSTLSRTLHQTNKLPVENIKSIFEFLLPC